MNKILSMTLVLGGALFLGSCVSEEEDLFDDLDDEDEYEIPVDVKGTSAKWRVPLGD